jgi:hypothetical protein
MNLFDIVSLQQEKSRSKILEIEFLLLLLLLSFPSSSTNNGGGLDIRRRKKRITCTVGRCSYKKPTNDATFMYLFFITPFLLDNLSVNQCNCSINDCVP